MRSEARASAITGGPFDLIVVGGGIAGSAAALRAAQYEHIRTLWIRGDRATRKRSRSQWVVNIDNMIGLHHGVVRGKLVRALKGEEFAAAREALRQGHEHISTRDIVRNTIERLQSSYSEQVVMVDVVAQSARGTEDGLVVVTPEGEVGAPWLLLATGVTDRQPTIRKRQGDQILEELRWIFPFANRETVLYCIRCEGHMTRETATAVIGHSDTAAQIAMMLYERYGSACSLLTNGKPPAWSERSGRLLEQYSIAVHTERIVEAMGTKGDLHGLVLEGGRTISVRMALVALGLHRVYNDLARDLGAELADAELPEGERHVLIDWKGETSVRGLFAIGDMVKRRDGEPVMKQVYTAQEYAVRAIDSIDRRMRSARRSKLLGDN